MFHHWPTIFITMLSRVNSGVPMLLHQIKQSFHWKTNNSDEKYSFHGELSNCICSVPLFFLHSFQDDIEKETLLILFKLIFFSWLPCRNVVVKLEEPVRITRNILRMRFHHYHIGVDELFYRITFHFQRNVTK